MSVSASDPVAGSGSGSGSDLDFDFDFDPDPDPILRGNRADGVPDAEVVPRASARLAGRVHRTPVLGSRSLDERSGATILLKCENFQKVGAFKFRGAMNAILCLDEDSRRRGVVTHSSGNHAQALALAARLAGVPARVVMPRTAPAVKRAATEGYGAVVVPCEPTLEAREGAVADLIARHGYTLIHPYDDWRVVAGQGTAAWELLEENEARGGAPLDALVAPVGGGGLLAGTVLAAEAFARRRPGVGAPTALAGEPRAADDAARSLAAGRILPSENPVTLADGLKTSLGVRPFAVIRGGVSEILTVSEEEILETLRFAWERLKIVIEPSAAVALAPFLLDRSGRWAGRRIGIVLSGGNVDMSPWFEGVARGRA